MPIILGGGISGLAAAHYLIKQNYKNVKILESSDRVGGWIKTNLNNGYIFEQGPRTIRPKGKPGMNTLQLVEDLKLQDQIVPISSSHIVAKNRMVYVGSKLHKLPSDIMSLFQVKSPFTKPLISALWKDYTTPSTKVKNNDESIYNFAERRFGKEIADFAISPMICGICAGDAKDISVKFLMKDLFELEQKHGSAIKGLFHNIMNNEKKESLAVSTLGKLAKTDKWSIYSFKNGLETLTQTLESTLKSQEVDIMLNSRVTGLQFEPDHVKIEVNGTQEIRTNHVISSLPAHRLSLFLAKSHPQLFNDLQAIPTVSVAVVNLMYDTEVLTHKAFGFLIPPQEKLPVLGVIFDSCCFPTPGRTVLTVMMGGKWFKTHFGNMPSKENLYDVAESHVNSILGITSKPSDFNVNILEDCIPQYIVGHTDRVFKIKDYIRKNKLRLALCGSSYEGVGVNDVILSARNAIDAIPDNIYS